MSIDAQIIADLQKRQEDICQTRIDVATVLGIMQTVESESKLEILLDGLVTIAAAQVSATCHLVDLGVLHALKEELDGKCN